MTYVSANSPAIKHILPCVVGPASTPSTAADQGGVWPFLSGIGNYRDFYSCYATNPVSTIEFDLVKQREFTCS